MYQSWRDTRVGRHSSLAPLNLLSADKKIKAQPPDKSVRPTRVVPVHRLAAVGSGSRLALLARELIAHTAAELMGPIRDRVAGFFPAGRGEQHSHADSHTYADQQSSRRVHAAMIFTADHFRRPTRPPRRFAVSVTCTVAQFINAFV